MASSPTSPEVARFGQFEANLRSRELRREGVSVRLPDQSFEVLAMLLERPGELVGREEIRKRLWSDDIFVDFDHGLNNAVNRLRDALGDSAESPRFVETLPRRGYRFVGQLHPPEQSVSNGETSKANYAPPNRPMVGKLSLAWIGIIASLLPLAWLGSSVVRRLVVGSDHQRLAIRSIAVLPLENLSGDSSQDYFADGITEQLITELGQVKSLRVISHTSVNQYKATTKTVPVIARELQVDALVEGTVTRSEGRVRVTANLVQANPEKHLWAEAYDRDMHDVLSLQAELSQAIAREVRIEITPKERESFVSRHPTNLEAQEAYLKGLYHFARGKDQLFVPDEGKQELYKANDYFQQAITIDPQYAQAYAGLARSNTWLGILEPPAIDAARVASDRAISLDENLPEPHMVRGGLLLGAPDWAGAEHEFLRSIELNPSYAEAHQGYGIFLSLRGRFDEATTEMDRAVMLDPVGRSPKTQAAWVDVCAGNYDKAIMRLQNITELFPNDALSHEGLGTAYVLRGRFKEGIAELSRSAQLSGKDPSRSATLGWAYAISGQRDQALQILDEIKRESAHDADIEYEVALIYAGLGDNDQVFIWLDKAYRDRHDVLNEVWREPQLIPLRMDPRLHQLARKLGIIA